MPNYKPLFKKNLLMMIILVFFILVVILFINFLYDKKSPSVSLGGSFILTDQNGEIFNSSKVNLKKLIYFGYTYCPDICPFDLLKISKIFENNPNLKSEIKPVFITVDPERDTIKNLKGKLEGNSKTYSGWWNVTREKTGISSGKIQSSDGSIRFASGSHVTASLSLIHI